MEEREIMRKRLLKLTSMVLAGTMLVSMATGCSSSNTTTETGEAAATTETTDEVTASSTEETSTDGEAPVYGDNLVWDGNVPVNNGEDVSLLVYAPSGTIGDYYVEWANNYMQLRPNVKIDIQLQTEDVAQKVILETQNGTAPDMFSTHNGWNTAIVNTCGMPWTQDRFNIDGLLKDYVGLEQFKYNDNIYYIPYGIMTSGIFYDKDQWAEAGLTEEDIPKTWDQLITVAQKLTKVDDNGKMTVAGFGFNGNISFLLETLNYEKGLPMFDKEGTPIIDDPIVAENIQFIQKLYDEYKVNDRNFDTAANTFATGESAMIYNWGWLTYSLKSTAPDKNIGYFQTPSFVEGEVCPAYGRNGGDSSLAVSATLKDEAKIEAAFDFLTYLLANDDAVYEFDELLSMYPRKISLRENQEKIDGNVVFKELKNYVDRTVWPGPVPGSYADNNYITYVVDPIFKENADIASTLTSAQKVCSDALAEEGNWFFSERDYQYASEFIK